MPLAIFKPLHIMMYLCKYGQVPGQACRPVWWVQGPLLACMKHNQG